MTTKARGNSSELVYIAETTKGSTPASGTVAKVRYGSETFDYNQPREYDGDIVSDGQHESTVSSVSAIPGGFNFQLSHQALDDFIPPLCGKSAYTTVAPSLDGAITVVSGVGTFTATNTPDLSGLTDGAVFTLAGTALNNDEWLCTAFDDGADTITFVAFRNGQADPVADAGISGATATFVTSKTGGDNYGTFTFDKRLGAAGSDDCSLRFRGMQPNGLNLSLVAGGAVSGDISFLGTGQTVDDDGIVSPTGYSISSTTPLTAADDTTEATGGSVSFAVNDRFWFADDEVERAVVSIGAANDFSFSPAIETGTTISAGTTIFAFADESDKGLSQKMENNLAYLRVDDAEVCVQSVNLAFSNNAVPANCVGTADPDTNEPADKTCSGSIAYYVDDNSIELMKKVRAGTAFQIVAVSVDRSDNVFGFVIHSADASPEEAKIGAPGVITQNINFNALKESTYGAYITFFKA